MSDRAAAGAPPDQLPLPVGLRAESSFDDFVPGDNALALAALREHAATGVGCCYVWGPAGTGKSHLLAAACAARGSAGIHLCLGRAGLVPAVLDGLERVGLVCLDGVDVVAGDAAWGEALFHLYNRIETRRGALLASARCAPAGLEGALGDLRSRLGAGLVLQLRPLDDGARREALRLRARRLGFELGGDVCDYLLTRCSRDMHDLFGVLATLDRHTLAAKRRPTVPFLKELLGR